MFSQRCNDLPTASEDMDRLELLNSQIVRLRSRNATSLSAPRAAGWPVTCLQESCFLTIHVLACREKINAKIRECVRRDKRSQSAARKSVVWKHSRHAGDTRKN